MENDNNIQGMMKRLMENAKTMQEGYSKMTAENKHKTVKAYAGGDMVEAEVNYLLEVVGVKFSEAAFNEDKAVLEDLTAGAINQAMVKAKEAVRDEMTKLTKGAGLPEQFAENFTQ